MVHEGIDFLYPKCSKTHLRESLIPKFSGDYTLDPIKGKEGEGKKEDGRRGGKEVYGVC